MKETRWARGLFRLWIVFVFFWLAASIFLTDVYRVFESRDIEITATTGDHFDFPPGMDVSTVRKAIADWYSKHDAQNVFNRFDGVPDRQRAVDVDVQKYTNANAERSATQTETLRTFFLIFLVPPMLLLVFGSAGVWVFRGFRPAKAEGQ